MPSLAYIRHILLDLDGVLADFVRGCNRHFVRPEHEVWTAWAYPWDPANGWGITEDQFWAALDATGFEFWAELKPLPWAQELLRLVHQSAPWTIATSPSESQHAPAGKIAWLREHVAKPLGLSRKQLAQRTMLGSAKHLLAKPNVVLIDDSPEKCQEFRDAGGLACLFPAPWNEARKEHEAGMHVQYVRDFLQTHERELCCLDPGMAGMLQKARGSMLRDMDEQVLAELRNDLRKPATDP